MNASDLYSILTGAPLDHSYTVLPISKFEGIYFGIDRALRPCFFVKATSILHEPPSSTLRISLYPNQAYQISILDGSQQNSIFHVLICDSNEHSDAEAFMVLVDAFVAQSANLPTAERKLFPFFRSIARLFALDRAKDLVNERQGLWGELFLMKNCRGYLFWAPYWHSEVTRLFDFSVSKKRLEVKTSASGLRVHHFSHRQIYSSENDEIVVASLLLREDDTGLSLRDLIIECRSEIQFSPHFLKLEKAVRHTKMDDSSEMGPKFNHHDAKESIGWYRSYDIPHFTLPEPPGVSQTTYKADLSTAPNLETDELINWIDSWQIPIL